ncbi:MAG: hypothetical protein LDL33_10425 [Desulfomonile sp.]|nr:hypothetical protein [Desulfomonile sp.]
MKTIGSNDAYWVAVEEIKNRIYLTNRGSWTDVKQVAGWLDDLAAATKLCRRGFTVLVD